MCHNNCFIFLFLVLIVQLVDRNSNTHKIGKKTEHYGTNFHDWANFYNFCGMFLVIWSKIGEKEMPRKVIEKFCRLNFLPVKKVFMKLYEFLRSPYARNVTINSWSTVSNPFYKSMQIASTLRPLTL